MHPTRGCSLCQFREERSLPWIDHDFYPIAKPWLANHSDAWWLDVRETE